MRAIVMSVVLGIVAVAWAGAARADQVQAGVSANVDSNYRYHNGRWWYWQPSQNHWMVYHNNGWVSPNAQGAYYFNGAPIFGGGSGRYSTGYRGNYYGNNYYGNGYYDGYYNGYGNPYNRGRGYGYGGYGYGGYGYGNRGANVGGAIGGAVGGGRGAGIGAAIGGAIDR